MVGLVRATFQPSPFTLIHKTFRLLVLFAARRLERCLLMLIMVPCHGRAALERLRWWAHTLSQITSPGFTCPVLHLLHCSLFISNRAFGKEIVARSAPKDVTDASSLRTRPVRTTACAVSSRPVTF